MAKIGLALGLLLVLSLLGSILPITPAVATPEEVKWSEVNIPTEGKPGKWVLADGSHVQHLTIAIDDSLYGYVKNGGGDWLFKSDNDGRSWSQTDYEGNAITDIACSSLDADLLYVTDGSHVYQSDDAGSSFYMIADATLPALDTNESITCLDAGFMDDEPYLFIGTADGDNGNFGGVWYLAETHFGAGWIDLEVGNYDVYSIACSPRFKDDALAIAVVTDESKTYAVNNYGVVGEWSNRVELVDGSANSFAISAASDICFPSDFDETYELFVGVVSDTLGITGDVYQVTSDTAYELSINKNISSLDLIGEAFNTELLAGENDSAEVWYSPDDGDTWHSTDKLPSGDGPTYVVMAADFANSGRAYAATSGTESAFSYTADGGITWNQLSLIDTKISNIADLSLSPNYSQDDTLFMLTFDEEHIKHSLWRSLNGGARWERVFTSSLANVDSVTLVELSPQYGNGSQVVFLAGISNGNPAIWRSTDNGQSFIPRSAPFPVDIWAVVNDNSLFIGCYDAINNLGLVYATTNSGRSYPTGAVAGSQSLNSIALSPNYEQDKTILVGSTDGWVYWSNDNGTTFEPLPADASTPPFTDSVVVAFDPDYSHNDTVYAANNTEATTDSKERIYRFIIGESDTWESIDTSLAEGGMLSQLIVSAEGTLYATNSQPVDAADKEGGLERCLIPTYSLGPTFETVTRGLDDGVKLTGLWLYDNQLWSIDTANTRLMTYTDSLTLPVTLTSPPDKVPGIDTGNVNLDWEALTGATSYKWQLDYDTDFSSVPTEFEGNTDVSSARLPTLELATTYYWRVRATEPVLSPWSAKWSFTTSLGGEVIAPKLYNPETGARGMPLKPIFQWSAIAEANGYELLVSTDVSFTNPIIVKIDAYALPATAWQCDITLDYDTTYYWKVRATSSESHSAWSAVGAFTTEPPPLLEPSPPPELSPPPTPPQPEELPAPPPPPPASPQTTTPDWVKYLIGALLASVVLLSAIVLVLVVGIRRS